MCTTKLASKGMERETFAGTALRARRIDRVYNPSTQKVVESSKDVLVVTPYPTIQHL